MKNDASLYRWRFGLGLLIPLIVGLGILTWLGIDLQEEQNRHEVEREGIITVMRVADSVKQASSDEVGQAISEIQKQNPSIKMIRVIRGTRLEGSTAPSDQGSKAAPRRLNRDEKYLYDLGQRLRAAVQTNQEEGAPRKAEIEISRTPSGGLLVAAPLESDGAVVGAVQVETAPKSYAAKTNWILIFGALLVPLLLYWVASRFVTSSSPYPLAALSSLLLVAVLFWYGRQIGQTAEPDRVTLEKSSVAKGQTQEAPNVAAWDTDIYRRPRGSNEVEQERIAIRDVIWKSVIASIIVSLGILAFFGFGGAFHLATTLSRYRQAYAYSAPALIGMLVLVFFPFIYGIALSFTGSSLYNTDKSLTDIWVGLRNYKEILGDFDVLKRTPDGIVVNYSNFYYTFYFTVVWTVSNVAIGVTIGLLLALILNTKGLAMRPLYRVLLIFPWAMPNYITALIWRGMFHQQFGVINQAIQLFGGSPVSWFEKPTSAFFTALATNGWLSFPFMMVVSLGALQSIPADLYEAARVDGATRWQQFRLVTLPSLKPALIPAIILSVVWTFNMFNIIYLVTGGQPAGSTEILITQAYKIAFEQYRYGYAAAYSTIIFIILLVYGVFQNRFTRATEAIAE